MLAIRKCVRKHRGPLNLIVIVAAAARPSCMLLGGSSPIQSSPFSSAKSYMASQSSLVMHAAHPPAPCGEAGVFSVDLLAGF